MTEESSATARVCDTVDALLPRLVEAVSAAIQIPSVNPKYPGQDYDKIVGAEGEVSQMLVELYKEAGADTELIAVERGRDNACGRIKGTGQGRSLLLNGHVDVVPAAREDLWSHAPFSGQVTDDRVYGRGATDMKSGTLSAAFAAIALRAAGIELNGDLVLQGVVGEEVGDHECGTTAASLAGYTADAAIICEPTGGNEDGAIDLAPVAPGLLWFSLSFEGKTAHAGFRGPTIHPTRSGHHLGVNTVDKYWVIYQALRQLEDEWAQDDRHPLYAPGHFSLLPGVLHASPVGIDVPFLLADALRVEYCVLHNPDRSNEDVVQQIKEVVGRACNNDPWLREHPPTFEWKLLWPGYTAPTTLDLRPALAQAHIEASGGVEVASAPREEGFFGVCDITWLAEQGVDGLMYGPGVTQTAHAENEFVPIHQMATAVKTYALTAMNYCGYQGQ